MMKKATRQVQAKARRISDEIKFRRSLLLVPCLSVGVVVAELVMPVPQLTISQPVQAQPAPQNLTKFYDKFSPAVVSVEVPGGSGTGTLIQVKDKGRTRIFIVTAAHVTDDHQEVRITLKDGRKYTAQTLIAGHFNCMDLAILEIQGGSDLPTTELASANAVQIGGWVATIGNPIDTKFTITQGIISNLDPARGLILSDVEVNPGNSGGALFDRQGQLLGVIKGVWQSHQGGGGLTVVVGVEQVRALIQSVLQGVSPTVGKMVILKEVRSGALLAPNLPVAEGERRGSFEKSDHAMCGDSSAVDLHSVEGEADQPIFIEVEGQKVLVALIGQDGQVIGSTKSGDSDNGAAILTKLPYKGKFTLVLNALKPEQTGAYKVQVTTPLLVEGGKLTDHSPRMKDGSPYTSYHFEGKAHQNIDLVLHQFGFEPYITLLDASGKIVIEAPIQI